MIDPDPQPDPGEPRPWEAAGRVRRDCEPHRGKPLYVAAIVTVVLGNLQLGVFGLPMAVAVYVLARGDLGKIRAGLLDPAGRRETEFARSLAFAGILVNALMLLAGAVLLAALLFR